MVGTQVNNPVPAFDVTYGYDADGNRRWTQHLSDGQSDRSEAYGVDNRNRLRTMDRGELTLDGSGGSVEEGDYLVHEKLASKEDWVDLDHRGNWLDFHDAINGHERRETRVANGANAYLNIDPDNPDPLPNPDNTAAPVNPEYDLNGNLIFDPLARSAIANPCAPITSGGSVPFECRANNACAPAKAGCGVGQEYVYDAENRVVSIHRDTNDAKGPNYTGSTILKEPKLLEFVYDALGRRVETREYVDAATGATSTEPKITRHVYVGLENIQDWTWNSSASPAGYYVKQQYLWGDPVRFPEPLMLLRPFNSQLPSGSPQIPANAPGWHYLHDVLGSVIGIVDDGGNFVERYTYDPYGKVFVETWNFNANENQGVWEPVAESTSGLPYSPLGNPWMWTGQRYDAAVGLYYTWGRTLNPVWGRWNQRDPIEYKGDSINLYEYVISDPLDWIDALGLDRYTKRPFWEQHSYVGFDEYDDNGNKTGRILWYDFAPPGWKGRGGKKTKGWLRVLASAFVCSRAVITGPVIGPGDEYDKKKESTREQDKATQERIRNQQTNPPKFELTGNRFLGSPGQNCIGWSECYFNDVPPPEDLQGQIDRLRGIPGVSL